MEKVFGSKEHSLTDTYPVSSSVDRTRAQKKVDPDVPNQEPH